jgi:RNA polymerase sigma factor (sigma-70 family)
VTGEVVDAGSNPRARAIRDEEMARFATCLERLPEDMQRVLLARHTGDVPYAELAQAIGRSEGAVRRLREEYDQG